MALRCFNCNETGHRAKECRQPKDRRHINYMWWRKSQATKEGQGGGRYGRRAPERVVPSTFPLSQQTLRRPTPAVPGSVPVKAVVPKLSPIPVVEAVVPKSIPTMGEGTAEVPRQLPKVVVEAEVSAPLLVVPPGMPVDKGKYQYYPEGDFFSSQPRRPAEIEPTWLSPLVASLMASGATRIPPQHQAYLCPRSPMPGVEAVMFTPPLAQEEDRAEEVVTRVEAEVTHPAPTVRAEGMGGPCDPRGLYPSGTEPVDWDADWDVDYENPPRTVPPRAGHPTRYSQVPYCDLVARGFFEARREDELSCSKWAKVRIVGAESKLWWKGELDGKVGFIPRDWLALDGIEGLEP